MKLLIALVVSACVSSLLCAEESTEQASSEDTKKDCVFEVRPKLDADKAQLEQDLDAKLAQFDDCIDRITVVGHGRAGSQTSSGSQSQGIGAATENVGKTDQADEGATETSHQGLNKQEESETKEDPANLADDPSPQRSDPMVLADTNNQDKTRDVQNKLLEDDVAKLLREAAEKETDPTRKASLQKNYDDYMASRRK